MTMHGMNLDPAPSESVIAYIPSLRAYARGLTRQADEADDLVQETLLKALANIDKFKAGTNLRAWLFTIMRNSFLTGIRKRKRECPGIKNCASTMLVSQPSHDNRIAAQRLATAIAQLPPHYREIMILVLVLGESYEDAARICGCAIGTVKSRVSRARDIVVQSLGADGLNDFLDTVH